MTSPDVKSNPRLPRGSRLIAFVFSLVGVGATLFILLATLDGPNSVISVTETVGFRDDPSTISVRVFGYELYSRTESNRTAIDRESLLWFSLPFILIFISGILGWFFGRWFSYRVMKYNPRRLVSPLHRP